MARTEARTEREFEGKATAGSAEKAAGKSEAARARQRMARIRAERTAAGLCAACGKESPMPGKKLCQACREREKAKYSRWLSRLEPERLRQLRESRARWNRERQARREAQGLCLLCGQAESSPGRKHCPACLEKLREAARKKYRKLAAQVDEATRLTGKSASPAETLARIREERPGLPDWEKDHSQIRGRLSWLLFDAFYMEQSLERLYGEAAGLGKAPGQGWREFVQGEITRRKKAALMEWAKDSAEGKAGGQEQSKEA